MTEEKGQKVKKEKMNEEQKPLPIKEEEQEEKEDNFIDLNV